MEPHQFKNRSRPSLWDSLGQGTSNRVFFWSGLMVAVVFMLLALMPLLEWSGSSQMHIGAEAIAAVLAATVGFTLLFRSHALNESWLKVLGIGFLAVAGLDTVHALLSSGVVVSEFGSIEERIAWSSLASRTVLGAFSLFAALSLESRFLTLGDLRTAPVRSMLLVLTVVLVALLMVTTLMADRPSPDIASKLAFLPGGLFFAAFMLVENRRSKLTSMYVAFPVFLFANGISDVVLMGYSALPFDGFFSLAHMFKMIGYATVLFGILAETQRLYRIEAATREDIGRINDALNQANLDLTTATNDLIALNEIGKLAGHARQLTHRFNEIGELVKGRIPCDRLLVATMRPDGVSCEIKAVFGTPLDERGTGDTLSLEGSFLGAVFTERETLTFDDDLAQHTAHRDPKLNTDIEAGFRSWISAPIIIEDDVIGAVMARSFKPNAYEQREIRFVEQIASQLAGPLQVHRSSTASTAHDSERGNRPAA